MLLSKSELARQAGVSVLTIDRIEKGMSCRMETKRKILTALGIDFSESRKIFVD
jgi:predicted transcriptional regulator